MNIEALRARIREYEAHAAAMTKAPAPVRERAEFDLKALKLLLSLLEKK